MTRWIVPHTKANDEKISFVGKIKKSLAERHAKLNRDWSLNVAIFLIFGVNAILFGHRAYEFKDMMMLKSYDTNIFYMISRACGKFEMLLSMINTQGLGILVCHVSSLHNRLLISGRCLNFSTVLVIILILRLSITKLRNLGLSTFLPLDHNIYLHKLTGYIIFVLAWLHAIMHICNVGTYLDF